MKKVKILVLTVALFAIALSACGSNRNPDDTDTIPETNVSNQEQIEPHEYTDNTELSENNSIVWVVEPILEYDFIYYCCFFSTECHGGEFICSVTGQIIDWPQDLAFGHGPLGRGWVYDPQVTLLGFGGVGDYSGMDLRPIHEWADSFAWGEPHGIMLVQLVDSTVRDITEAGTEFLSDDAHSGKFAVMDYPHLVTDFIFGSGLGGVFFVFDTIPVYIGDMWGLIDTNGNVAIPFMFEHVVRIDNDTAFARYNGKYGIINIPLTIANFMTQI